MGRGVSLCFIYESCDLDDQALVAGRLLVLDSRAWDRVDALLCLCPPITWCDRLTLGC